MINTIYSYFKNSKFKHKLLFVFMRYFIVQLIIFTTIICIAASYIIRKNDIEMTNTNENQLRRIEDMSTSVYTQADRIAASLCIDKDANIFIHTKNLAVNYSTANRLTERLVYYKNILNCIDSIYIYSPEFNRLCTTSGLYNNESECMQYGDYDFISGLSAAMTEDTYVVPRKMGGRYPRIISLCKKTYSGGFVVINLGYEKFIDTISPVFDSGTKLYILNSGKDIVFPENLPENETKNVEKLVSEKSGTMIDTHDKNIYSAISIGYYKQNFAVRADISEFVRKKRVTAAVSFLVFIFFAVTAAVISFFLALSSMKIVVKLHDVIENEKFDISDMDESEEKHLISEIINLIDNNREFKRMLDERLEDYNKSQIMALQKQINPHFLNNILSMISYKIADVEGVDSEALKMILMLTRIIRYGFDSDNAMVSLRQELDFIDSYIKILKEEYDDFEFNVNVPPELYDAKILRLSIQPFIENAAYHGIHSLKSSKKISLSATDENGKMIIVIEDNGIGINAETLAKLNDMVKTGKTDGHIGTYNTYKRMEMIYSHDFDLIFESDGKTFSRVVMKIPL